MALTPGPQEIEFNNWYDTKFKPAMERGPLDKYVARQAWFAATKPLLERIAELTAQVEQAAQPVADFAAFEAAVQEYIEDYEMLGETEYGRDACYTPNAGDRAMLLDAFMGFDFSLYTSPPKAAPLTEAATDVLAERQRQISAEGWTPEHDDEHHGGQLAQAAACYALHTEPVGNIGDYLRFWPWASHWWKPANRRLNLVKACALILAEIERLDRANGITPATVEKG